MMKDIINVSNLNSGSQDVIEYPNAIPNGKIWVIGCFGGIDINLGDSKSSVYILRFGTDILSAISLSGNTKELTIHKEIIGDGTKKLNVVRQNKSGFNKDLVFWVKAQERQT